MFSNYLVKRKGERYRGVEPISIRDKKNVIYIVCLGLEGAQFKFHLSFAIKLHLLSKLNILSLA